MEDEGVVGNEVKKGQNPFLSALKRVGVNKTASRIRRRWTKSRYVYIEV